MTRLTALAFVAALALGCTDGDTKTPAAQAPTGDVTAATAAPSAQADQSAESATAAPSSPEPGKLLAAGQPAPDFETVAHDGTAISMKALRGKPVVVYFYPRDATPG